jgi:signal transduction histidine kinase
MVAELAKIALHLEKSGQPIWLWEPKRRRIIWANQPGREFWGVQSIFDLAARSFATHGTEARAMAALGAEREAMLNLPGGPVSALLDIAALAFGELGKVHLVRLSRIRPEPKARSSAKSRDLFQSAPIGLCLLDPLGRSLEENRAWAKLAGGPGKALATLAGEKAAAGFLLTCIANGRAEVSFRSNSKRLRLFGKCLKTTDGNTPLVYVRAEDVTVQYELEMLLTQLARTAAPAGEEVRGQSRATEPSEPTPTAPIKLVSQTGDSRFDFVTLLGHELRNQLRAIIGFSEIMQQAHFGPLGNARYEGYARDIRLSAEHLLKLVNDIFELACIESGQRQFEHRNIAIGRLIDECVSSIQPEARRYALRLEKEIAPGLPDVIADDRSLRQVLSNLLSNAVKHVGKNGRVKISAVRKDCGPLIVTIDEEVGGVGEGDLQRAIEPLGQIEKAELGIENGPDLCLPIARALTQANMAEFGFMSTPRHGTKTELRFPPERLSKENTAASGLVTATA